MVLLLLTNPVFAGRLAVTQHTFGNTGYPRTKNGRLKAEYAANVKFANGQGSPGAAMELGGSRPNVIIVPPDDLDNNSLNRMLASCLMPALKSLVIDQGTKFGDAFFTTSWCCPSRATLLKGQYSHNHNALTNSRWRRILL